MGEGVQEVFALLARRQWDAALQLAEGLVVRFPDSADAWNVLGLCAAARGELTLATQIYPRAAALDAGFAEAENNLGSALAGLGRADEAMAAFHRALRIRPDYLAALDNLLLASNCASSLRPEDVASLHCAWGRLVERQIAPVLPRPRAPRQGRPGRRLRIGYLSADFKRH